MRGSIRKVICWDLDETLGSFREPGKERFIPGIRPLLGRLRDGGVHNVITTGASFEHAAHVMGVGNVADLFSSLFWYRQLCPKGNDKHYLPVARSLGISESDAPHIMLVIGNRIEDAGADMDLSFILNRMAEDCTAAVYDVLLGQLMSLSDSWTDAHTRLRSMAREQYRAEGEIEGGLCSVSGLQVVVGKSLADRSKLAPLSRLIEVHAVPSGLVISEQ